MSAKPTNDWEWKLDVEREDTVGAGGRLDHWGLEICAGCGRWCIPVRLAVVGQGLGRKENCCVDCLSDVEAWRDKVFDPLLRALANSIQFYESARPGYSEPASSTIRINPEKK